MLLLLLPLLRLLLLLPLLRLLLLRVWLKSCCRRCCLCHYTAACATMLLLLLLPARPHLALTTLPCRSGQIRKTRQPYVTHCIETALIVEGLLSPTEEDARWAGGHAVVAAAAWCIPVLSWLRRGCMVRGNVTLQLLAPTEWKPSAGAAARMWCPAAWAGLHLLRPT